MTKPTTTPATLRRHLSIAITAWRLAAEGHAHIGTRAECWAEVIRIQRALPVDASRR